MRQLHREGALIVTDHGKPRALLLPMDEATFLDDVADLISRRANRALESVRSRAEALGLDKMSGGEIEAKIKAVRKRRPVPA
jgi:antitoxin (DNA-binding transcriptional repressor) of toxin-antitoxin stability system